MQTFDIMWLQYTSIIAPVVTRTRPVPYPVRHTSSTNWSPAAKTLVEGLFPTNGCWLRKSHYPWGTWFLASCLYTS